MTDHLGQDTMTDPHASVRVARASFAYLFEPGNKNLRFLVTSNGPESIYAELQGSEEVSVWTLRRELRGTPPAQLWDQAKDAVAAAARAGQRIVIPEDPDWPPRLTDLAATDPDPDIDIGAAALCLWVRGNAPVAATLDRSITITGAHNPTAYGTHIATQLAAGATDRGWTVVASGGLGIATAAHRGALVRGGATVAVLPCGLDRAFPAGNADLLTSVTDRGLLISFWPPGTPPTQERAATLRPVLAALSAGTVLVETPPRASSLQVLRHAINIGRPAMVVPGPITSVLSAGCHQVLRQHAEARLVTGIDDVLTDLAAPNAGPPNHDGVTPSSSRARIPPSADSRTGCPIRSGKEPAPWPNTKHPSPAARRGSDAPPGTSSTRPRTSSPS